ncbi:unnamed protein product [Orchesella dallaii]|uniref:DUF243 domain-containing protein n=1 Tax=Orchesella dallaii TaxID=48710 RepID=A0ABP1RHZ7_9HEXA
MKTFLILASALGVAYAGVGQLSPSEEADALNLFDRLCSGYGAEGQDIGGTLVYCKRASGEISETRNHRVNVPGQNGQSQTVFIQPPPARYQHNVEIVSDGNQGGQTKIYVLPQQASHTINPQIQQNPGTQSKPVVYFLKGGNSNSGSVRSDYGAPAPPPPQPILRESYGAPAPPPPQPILRESYGAPAQPVVRSGYGAPEPLQGYSRVARSNNEEIPANYMIYPTVVESVEKKLN